MRLWQDQSPGDRRAWQNAALVATFVGVWTVIIGAVLVDRWRIDVEAVVPHTLLAPRAVAGVTGFLVAFGATLVAVRPSRRR